FEVALYRLVESWGVRPDFVMGHSVGELVAAHVAGALSLQDACRLVAARGGLMQALPAGGAMLSVQAPLAEVEELLGSVDVAAVNGPASVVISGPETEIEAVRRRLTDLGVKTRRLAVSHAFHSSLMEPMLGEFERVASSVEFTEPRIPVVSNVSGRVAGQEMCTPAYWVRHIRESVRFADGMACLSDAGVTKFLELGPDATLTAMGAECVEGLFVPATRRGHNEVETFTSAVSRLWVSGVDVDWPAYFADRNPRRVDLPTYAFQRDYYWLESGPDTPDVTSAGLATTDHPLLGAAVSLAADGGVVLTGRLSTRTHPWLADHAVAGTVLFPGTGFVELAVRAGDEVGCGHLAELTLQSPLVLAGEGGAGVQVQVVVGAAEGDEGRRSLAVYSRSEGSEAPWTLHAEGVLAAVLPDAQAAPDLVSWPPAGAEPVDVTGFYDRAEAAGYGYGPAFQGMTSAWRRGDHLFAEVCLSEDLHTDAGAFGLHPALLDAALHTVLATTSEWRELRLPFLWEGVSLLAAGATAARVHITPVGSDSVSVVLADPAGEAVARVESLTLRQVTAEQLASSVSGDDDSLYRLTWENAPRHSDVMPVSDWAVIDPDEVLPALGGRCATLTVLLDADGAVPPTVLVVPAVADEAQETVAGVLALVQDWLAHERAAESQLVVVTRGAVASDGGDVLDLASAGVWGLVRSAQSEFPGRFVLLDLDATAEVHDAAVVRAALGCGEPQVAVRGGRVLVPRLVRAAPGGVGVGVGGLVVPASGVP
ncbi:acyltransferase domain-containing protein, partial [Streptomyces sp. NPDC058865]